jgi:hypothetical protein
VTRWVTHTHMGMGVNLYLAVDMGDPTGIFESRLEGGGWIGET